VTKQLTCAHCGDVIADAVYRPWRGSLIITSTEGYQLTPQKGAIQIQRAEQELASASSPAEEQKAQARLRYIKRYLGEVMYNLPCHRGHQTLATAPQITHALRHTEGTWVSLSEHAS
jgi:hypothetical protein